MTDQKARLASGTGLPSSLKSERWQPNEKWREQEGNRPNCQGYSGFAREKKNEVELLRESSDDKASDATNSLIKGQAGVRNFCPDGRDNAAKGWLSRLVFDVLDAHCHPCIMIGHFALLRIGAAVMQDHRLDLLIRNSQVAEISADIQSTGKWAELPLVRACGEDFLQPPPRVFERTDGTFSIKIWSEAAVRLLVDPTADGRVHNQPFLIETPCCETLNPVLLESDMHPGPEISVHKLSLMTTPNIRFLPYIRCQSASREPQSKVYIPTISRYFDALIAQAQWLKENKRRACRTRYRCELLGTVSVLRDANPKKEDIAITGQQVKEPDRGDFKSVQEDIQKQVNNQISAGGKWVRERGVVLE